MFGALYVNFFLRRLLLMIMSTVSVASREMVLVPPNIIAYHLLEVSLLLFPQVCLAQMKAWSWVITGRITFLMTYI